MKGLILALLFLPLAVQAQIYRTTDDEGNVVFTDTPPPTGSTGEEVVLPPVNTTPPPQPLPRLQPVPSDEDEEEETPSVDYGVVITAPENETTIPIGPGNFSVSAVVNPSLGSEDRLLLMLDGEPRGEPQTQGSWNLTNVFRGAHDLTVVVVSGDGEQVAISEPVRVYVLRPSIHYRK